MRSFRFSRFAIILMIACFFTILFAIGLATEMSRTVQMSYPGPNVPPMWWARLPGLFAILFVMLAGLSAIGYAVLFALRRSGMHRLSRLDIPRLSM
jgi:magnesium-transporting ATPase (P-type)